jgi:hypothetical protein
MAMAQFLESTRAHRALEPRVQRTSMRNMLLIYRLYRPMIPAAAQAPAEIETGVSTWRFATRTAGIRPRQ